MTWRWVYCAFLALFLFQVVQRGNAIAAALVGIGLGGHVMITIVEQIDRRHERKL